MSVTILTFNVVAVKLNDHTSAFRSDQCPIKHSLNIDIKYHDSIQREFRPSVAWRKCDNTNITNYRNELDKLLLQIDPMNEVFSCKNHKCTKHYNYINILYNAIIKYCKEAADITLPYTSLKEW